MRTTPLRLIKSTCLSSYVKSYDQIPTKVSRLPASIELLLSGGPAYLHEHCDRRHKELGPIYKDFLGPVEIVFLSKTELIQRVVANEGQYPHHNIPEAWTYYNELHKIQRGLFFQMGEPWLKLRKVISNAMLADPKSTSRFANDLYEINDDLLDSWTVQFGCNSDETDGKDTPITVPDIKAALNYWSIESTGCMLFDRRMGCVPVGRGSQVDDRARELVEHVTNMFNETSNFQLVPVRLAHKLNLGSWRRFERASSGMLRIANSYAAEHLARISQSPDNSKSILADIMRTNTFSREEIERSLVDLIIAAADTTSAALQWMIYLLAKHRQDLQPKIFKEISLASQECATIEGFEARVTLLKAFIKESLRLYPTAPFLARTLDRDIVLDGYKIPAGKVIVFSLYTTSRMEKYFDGPLEFKPERWLRSHREKRQLIDGPGCPHAYASLPFGIGRRMCVGRRAAELQIMIFLASLVRRFQVSLRDDDETKVQLRMILAPTKPIAIQLESR